jgi:hypothetical protein
MKEYIVLHCNNDGETEIKYYTKQELEEWLNDEDEVNIKYDTFLDSSDTELPWSVDGSWYLIIKGQVVVPQPKQVVTKLEI